VRYTGDCAEINGEESAEPGLLTGIDNKIKIYYLKTYGYLYFNICKVGIYYTICLSLIQIMEAQPSVANNILTH
jgi:hypothetical protein